MQPPSMWSGAGGWEGKLQHLIIVIIYWKKTNNKHICITVQQ